MHLLDPTMDMLPPFVCVLCERTPIRGGLEPQRVVDTLTDIEVDYAHHLEGRKYVCESCVREMATLMGLGDNMQDEIDLMQLEVAAYKATMSKMSSALDAVVNAEAYESRKTRAHEMGDRVPYTDVPAPSEPDPADAVKRDDFKGRLVVADEAGNRPTYPEQTWETDGGS